MKLDKIRFAAVVGFIQRQFAISMSEAELQMLDSEIDIDILESIEHHCYPKNENVEALMKAMAGGTNKIDAIREHRAITGMSLKESKDAVERYWPDGSKKLFSIADLRQKLSKANFMDEMNRNIVEAFIQSL